MPTITTAHASKVVALTGQAYIKLPDGTLRLLKVGDAVPALAVVVTSHDGIVELTGTSPDAAGVLRNEETAAGAQPLPVAPVSKTEVDRVIDALERGDADAAPAAGAAAASGSGGEAGTALHVDRVAEQVGTVSYSTAGLERTFTPLEPRAGNPERGVENAAPEALRTTVGIAEDAGPVAVDLTGRDAEDGTPPTVVVRELPPAAQGQLFMPDGVTPVAAGQALPAAEAAALVFVPAPNFAGTATVGFVVVDSAGAVSATQNAVIAVAAVNDAPLATPDSAVTMQDTPASGNVLGNDSDVDGPALSVTSFQVNGSTYAAGAVAALPGTGTLVLNGNGSYAFTPAPGFSGAVPAVAYTVSDGTATSSASLNVSVTPAGSVPVARPDAAAVVEDGVATGNVLANDSDADGDSLKVLQFSVAGGGSFAAGSTAVLPGVGSLAIGADGRFAFTPAPNFNGAVPEVNYTVSDGRHTGNATLTLSVAAVNDAPSAGPTGRTTPEDTPASGNVLAGAADADGDSLRVTQFSIGGSTYSAGSTATLAGVGTLVVNGDGSYTFTPAANHNGTVPIATYTVSDGVATTTSTLTIDVTPVNDGPMAAADSRSTAEDTATTGNVLANDSDVDGNPLSVTQFVVGGTTYLAGATATLAGVGTLVVNGDGSYTFNPAANYNGAVPVATYTVSDGTATTTSTLTINVTPVNDGPVAVADLRTTAEDAAIGGNVLSNDSDVDGNALRLTQFSIGGSTYAAGNTATLAGVGTLVVDTDGRYTFTPTANYNGVVPVATYTVSDGTATTTSTLTIDVTPVNDAPVAVADSRTTAEDTPVSGNVLSNDSDVDGNTLRVTQYAVGGATYAAGSTATLAGVGTLVVHLDGSYTFTPAPNYNGNPPVATCTVTDGTVTATATLTLTVTPVNDGPVANADSGSSYEDRSLSFTPAALLANDADVDGDTLTLTSVQGAVNGSVALVGGNVVFTPAADYNGPASFTYTTSDGHGGSATATVNLNVIPVNDAAEPVLRVRGVGRWTFDEAGGTTTRDAYNANTGTLNDAVTTPATVLPVWTSGHNASSGAALNFDGTGSRVAIDAAASQPLMGSTATLSFWIKTTQTGSGAGWDSPAVIASEQAGGTNDIQWGALNASGKIGFNLANQGGVYSSTSVNDNAWHQVAISRDAGSNSVNIYVDGRLETTGNISDPTFTGTLNRLAGFAQNNNFSNNSAGTDLTDNRFLNAQLDDVRIYDRVLTADQVRAVQSVEGGYHDTAIANDGYAMKLELSASGHTELNVSGLATGMVITDGTYTVTASSPDQTIDLTGWNTGSMSLSGAGSATLAFNASNTVGGETRGAPTQYLNIVTGTSLLDGTGGADTLDGSAAADLISGREGNDVLGGADGNDRLLGGTGDDALNGGAGHDILIGGAGNDVLTGGAGGDVFAWTLADRGTAGAPAVDTVADFNATAANSGGDVLDLRDLLQGANNVGSNAGNLQDFLDFNVVGGSTEIRISSSGGFAGGNYSAANEDQRIVLSGVDIRASLGLGTGTGDQQIIEELLRRGKVIGDGGP